MGYYFDNLDNGLRNKYKKNNLKIDKYVHLLID
jgi:hypothetical protein